MDGISIVIISRGREQLLEENGLMYNLTPEHRLMLLYFWPF